MLQEFHQHLNSIEPSIHFVEEDGQLPFLDVLLAKEDDGLISTSVYRKPTHTDHYLHFSSHHPQSHKQSVVRTLYSRAASLSSSSLVRSTEEVHISEALQDNGYPREFINYNLRRPSNSQQIHQLTQPSATVVLPYIQGQSESIRRILQQLDIRTIFKTTLTLRQILSHPKDPVPKRMQTGVIYKIPCSDCSQSYIGQTGRCLSLRLKEHQRAVRTLNTDTSALAEHVLSADHHIDWDNTTILDHHLFTQHRCLMESWYIHRDKNIMNREKGPLPEGYLLLMYSADHTPPLQLLEHDFDGCV